MVLLSGQGPFHADGALVAPGDFEAQARKTSGPQPASTALGVAALAVPGMMTEVQAVVLA